MKRSTCLRFLLLLLLASPLFARAQDDWPRSIIAADGSIIRISYPQPDSFIDNNIQFRAAFCLTRKGAHQPVYGSFQAWSVFETDRNNRTLSLLAANLTRLHLVQPLSPDTLADLRETIECGLSAIGSDLSLDRLISLLDYVPAPRDSPTALAHTPPRIILWGRPAILVLIDGIPRFKWNKDYGLYAVANSPNTIMESSDGWFYLYGGRHWYLAPTPEGPFQHTTYIAPDLHHVEALINSINDREAEHSDTLREGNEGVIDVLFSTTPATLVCTKGAPQFAPIRGTHLLYAANSDDDLFLDSLRHTYYLLVSGRWFSSPGLSGQWKYVPQDSLPRDFAAIPEGSAADRVLACVAGTDAAREAIIDAGIPQTITIDRRTASTRVIYDGAPKFAPIHGTHLQYAYNTPSIVLRSGNSYYCVDKGIWFGSQNPGGPWTACTSRPEEVSLIPPDCPVYTCKYVYIYGAGGNAVTTGYTTGYLGSYVDGPTLVYGTGYHYPCYAGNIVFPYSWTYGFNMWYNPWFGWSLGYDCSPDWLNTSMAWGEGAWKGGWFGPSDYRPPYIWHHFSGHGLYERDYRLIAASSYNNNLYTLRNDLPARPGPEFTVTDGDGNLYCPDGRNGWLQRKEQSWVPLDTAHRTTLTYLDRLRHRLLRGEMRAHNFRQASGVYIVSSPQSPDHGKTTN